MVKTKYVPKLAKSEKKIDVIHFRQKMNLLIKMKNIKDVAIKPNLSRRSAYKRINEKVKNIPFLFAPVAQNLSSSFFDLFASKRIKIEKIPRANPVTKGKNPEPGEVGVPIFSL